MNFIKANWMQGLVIAASCAVAGGLLTHHLTDTQAVAIGSMLAMFGIHLPKIVYAVDQEQK